jgi:hypothetical protein
MPFFWNGDSRIEIKMGQCDQRKIRKKVKKP